LTQDGVINEKNIVSAINYVLDIKEAVPEFIGSRLIIYHLKSI